MNYTWIRLRHLESDGLRTSFELATSCDDAARGRDDYASATRKWLRFARHRAWQQWRCAQSMQPNKDGIRRYAKAARVCCGYCWGHTGKGFVSSTWCRPPRPGELPSSMVISNLVVRNPYERLLSGYLGQVALPPLGNHSGPAAQFDKNADAHMQLFFRPDRPRTRQHKSCRVRNGTCSGYGEWDSTPDAFADFVRKITTFDRGVPFGNDFAMDHLAPISATDHPRHCLRAFPGRNLIKHYRVLKLERQVDWYASWVREGKLARYVSYKRWPGGCFWKASGQTCEQSLLDPQQQSEPIVGSSKVSTPPSSWGSPDSARRCSVAGGHQSGACTKMRQYYTAELAARATAFFADDLDLFSYPHWEPSDEQPAPSSGPDLSNLHDGVRRAWRVCGVGNNKDNPFNTSMPRPAEMKAGA